MRAHCRKSLRTLGVESTERAQSRAGCAASIASAPRQRNALALTAGQLARVGGGEPVELHQIQASLKRRARMPASSLCGTRAGCTRQAERDILNTVNVADSA